MYLLLIGLALLALKVLNLTAVGAWSWWIVFSPFALAVVWWAWADWSGYTKAQAMARDESRKSSRIRKADGTKLPTRTGRA